MASSSLTIIVTGANAGLGLGICERLLVQLAQKNPPDVQEVIPTANSTDPILPCTHLTLIMACRSYARAEASRKHLYDFLDAHTAELRMALDYDGHADVLRENLKIEIQTVDMSSVGSVVEFAKEISSKYTHISHLICNAGATTWTHINWPRCFLQAATDLYGFLTYPNYNVEEVGKVSSDGLGWAWQVNLFGHFAMFRLLEPLLRAGPRDGRVIWLSSQTASPTNLDMDDWQLLKDSHNYGTVKYQIDIVASYLDALAAVSTEAPRVRHIVVHPSVASTGIAMQLTGALLDQIKVICFIIARYLGSTIHIVLPFLAAVTATYAVLAPISALVDEDGRPCKYAAHGNRRGTRAWTKRELIQKWDEHKKDAEVLVERCDALLGEFTK
ncbi:NAD(P)-binding protein [Cylindrobasidium torrendii FP15055 ss-10]|uniref:NAD(P)-binding protein n=1 Tax=Cylindrobasidium torrendii FP15055 ss-10 TaxID=1314674 RepID=A0A0D7AYX3_9AGAR|nr:NAD(P)-binding protein [Cylindrobasidium torrendii FP15055 ss-10]